MDFTAFSEYMICNEDMQYYGTEDQKLGYEMKLTFPTYRGSFLCNVEKLRVFLDGAEIPESWLRILVNGTWYRMEEVSYAYKEYWFTGDKAVLRVLTEAPPKAGEYQVRVEMTYKVPYTGYFGNYMVNTRDCVRRLALR
ncbi:Uncharacterised protein [uncultured Roseburia sp.]|uniref:C-deglycosylation enzyme beta subunit n=1 Tax=Brotonthovivens ammoniilytica TaxID=2981725 RepID=A0ABT2TPX1_9FIRM|nr:DUF6379 domain-containing protein [Brotonthovivens ammoniilytica]MCU6763652.1 DUF6379 domain-containing protein [Brotonthovivens ammoniilytica]SCJ29469.1 Uncharacterised protein [uncultured Roseburia sp.]